MVLPPLDFESSASAISPPRLQVSTSKIIARHGLIKKNRRFFVTWVCRMTIQGGYRAGSAGAMASATRISVPASGFEKGRQVCRRCRRAAHSAGYVSAQAPEAGRYGKIAGPFRKKCATPPCPTNTTLPKSSPNNLSYTRPGLTA